MRQKNISHLQPRPVVAVSGRPNVGKSTLFNRITRTKDALVDNFPGVTRDRHYGDASWNDRDFVLIDTGGMHFDKNDTFSESIFAQACRALEDADAVIHLLDGKAGLSPFDADIIRMLRQIQKPVFYAVNKVDGHGQEGRMDDFHTLGMDRLYPVSAEHGYGVHDLLDSLTAGFDETGETPGPDLQSDGTEIRRIAVAGRPNVGKSSLINRILGEDRLIVSDSPGTTRDSIDSLRRINKIPYLLVDTAGIRRKKKVSQKLEKFSVIKSLKSLDRCDIALIMIDASEGMTDQDVTVAGYAHDRGCGCVFLLNKWDKVEKDRHTLKKYYEEVKTAAKFLSFAPIMTISALTGLRALKIFPLVEEVYAQYSSRVGTGPLNRILGQAIEKNEPSLTRGRRIKFYYATQISSRPPLFVCFVNYPGAVHFSYKRYLMNQIRAGAGLDKTPIRLIFRQRPNRKRPRNPKLGGKPGRKS
ncbi:GTPase Der [Candidatus Desulfarcum epimagneticum]|uniref:GTPase Der n=1 Tax=uncultured Desulfobacteraceae bacterium TaxID=218296 RepID=A0A484HCW1_9BACT|nr:GTPase Der [uncultured Desulfobacteraceae bacterium]